MKGPHRRRRRAGFRRRSAGVKQDGFVSDNKEFLMFRSSIQATVAGVVVAVVVGASSRPAFAIKQFFDEFKAVYVKADSAEPNDKALAAEVETAKCNVCHVGKSKKDRNAYGNALA